MVRLLKMGKLILLDPNKYDLALPKLLDVTINNLFARAVVERHVDGKVYVDDDTNPGAFYVAHPYGMSLLFGKVTDAFVEHHLKDYLLGRNGLRKPVEYLQVFPKEIEGQIDKILGSDLSVFEINTSNDHPKTSVVKYTRVNFKFNGDKYNEWVSTIDLSKYNFHLVDSKLFNETNGSVVPKHFWNNANDLTKYGIGYSLNYDQQNVAVVFSAFVHDNMLELGMETNAEYRRKGFGSIVCARLINYCIENNYEPIWACRLDNKGSYNLALKLGFEPAAHLPYYQLPMNTHA